MNELTPCPTSLLLLAIFVLATATVFLPPPINCAVRNVTSRTGHRPPLIAAHPTAARVFREGEKVQLTCVATGIPTPIINWLKDGAQINSTIEIFNPNLNSSLLNIIKATGIHEGIYQCTATNQYGTALSQQAKLIKAVLGQFPLNYEIQVHRIEVGMPLTLRCQPPISVPPPTVYWGVTRPRSKLRPIEYTDRITQDHEGNMHIREVEAGDNLSNATYTCVAENQLLRSSVQGFDQMILPINSTEKSGKNQTKRPQLMWSSPKEMTVLKGEEVRLKCIYSGIGTSITWKKSNRELSDQDKYSVSSFDQELIISNISDADAAAYGCFASVAEHTTSQKIRLHVESGPRFINQLESASLADGEDHEMKCQVQANPKPTITWLINGKPIDKEKRKLVQVIGDESRLSLRKLHTNDSCVVQCVARNLHSLTLSNAYVHVIAESPQIYDWKEERKMSEGLVGGLSCLASGAPTPTTTWYRYDSVYTEILETSRIKTNGNKGDMSIAEIAWSDTGLYKCSVSNKYGVDEKETMLIVRKRTLITFPPLDQRVSEGKSISFNCQATTDPEEMHNLSLTWYIVVEGDGENVEEKLIDGRSSHRYVISEGRRTLDRVRSTLTILEVKLGDSATVRCRASNGIDADETSAHLFVKGKPGKPSGVLLEKCLPTLALISWLPSIDNNDPVTNYVIISDASQSDDAGADAREEMITAVQHVSKMVEGRIRVEMNLKPWLNYSFSVQGVNSVGVSEVSDPTIGQCSTPPARVARNPKKICSKNGPDGYLVVIWEPLKRIDYFGKGLRYVVSYRSLSRSHRPRSTSRPIVMEMRRRSANDMQEIHQSIMTDPGVGEAAFYVGVNFKAFEVSVTTENDIGVSTEEPEKIIVYSTEGTPTAIVSDFSYEEESLGSDCVKFKWISIDSNSPNMHGTFKGYRVNFWKTDDPENVLSENLILNENVSLCNVHEDKLQIAGETLTLFTSKLWPNSMIESHVRVLNGRNEGLPSNSVQFTTLEGAPDPVVNLRLYEISSNHVRLRWLPPTTANSHVINYIVVTEDINKVSRFDTIVNSGPNQTQIDVLIRGLEPETCYNFNVSAKNIGGVGMGLSVQANTLSKSEFDRPLITFVNSSGSSIEIGWRSTDLNPPLNPAPSFYVLYRKIGKTDWMTKSTVEQRMSIENLEEGVSYEVMVAAGAGDDIVEDTQNENLEKSFSSIRVITVGSQSRWELGSVPIDFIQSIFILISIIAFVFLALFVIVCIVVIKRKKKKVPTATLR